MLNGKYYVISIQYNKDTNAENKSVPKDFDSLDDAIKEFHTQMMNDMENETLGWSLCMVINSSGNIIRNERWDRPVSMIESSSITNSFNTELESEDTVVES